MDNKKIRHITNDYFRKFKKDYKVILIGFDAEAIHQYRVHYKKLRAFLRMLSQQSKTDKIKISGKLKRTYKYAGAIRDLQLQEQKLAKALRPDGKIPAFCFHRIQPEMNKWKRLFGETADDKIIAAAKKKLENILPRKSTLSGFRKFAEKSGKRSIPSSLQNNSWISRSIQSGKTLKTCCITLNILKKLIQISYPWATGKSGQ